MTDTPRPEDQIPIATTARTVPTVFSDGLWFASHSLGIIRLQFIENVTEPSNSTDPGVKARHVMSIAMPKSSFDRMLSYLNFMKAIFDEDARLG
jgi:hypothetical protein